MSNPAPALLPTAHRRRTDVVPAPLRNAEPLQSATRLDQTLTPLAPLTAVVPPPSQDAAPAAAHGLAHGLFWMLTANLVGVLLALLLLLPELNRWLGEWTYGRWVPVHLNLHLYGWTSIPLLAWLLRIYRADTSPARPWIRSVFWGWSVALLLGGISWLRGQTSGKIFLDWTGFTRFLLPAAMTWLWIVLAWAWLSGLRTPPRPLRRVLAEGTGLLLLLTVPAVWFWSAGQAVYPVVNPHSGGPTATSLLGSTLIVVLLLLLLPHSLRQPLAPDATQPGLLSWPRSPRLVMGITWALFAAELLLFFKSDPTNASHHRLDQILCLGSLFVWIPALPRFYGLFHWSRTARRWRNAFLFWFSLLVVTGWASFLPGLLERLKYTDGLVAHSHLAMAGFVTTFNLFLLCTLLPGKLADRILGAPLPRWLWQLGTLGYVALMWVGGWIEGAHPDFTINSSPARTWIYALRLGCGLAMVTATALWFARCQRTRWRDALAGPEAVPAAAPLETARS